MGMDRTVTARGLTAGLAAALAIAALSPVASAQDTIKIGGGFALTGGESALDVPAYNGATLAVDEINAAGGIDGKQLEMVTHDSQYDMPVTTQVAHQYVEEDGVTEFIGYTDSDSVLASGFVFQDAGIPFITVGATSPKLPSDVGDMLFLASFGDNVQAAAGAEYAFKNFGDTAYLLFDNDQTYTTLLAQYFKTRFTELGGTIVGEDSYADGSTDFASQIAKITALPEAPAFTFLSAMPDNIGVAVKQMREAGITTPIVGGDGYDTPDLLKTAGDLANGVYFTTHALMDAQGGTEPIKKFMAAYEAKFNHPVENAFAALGYDTIYLLADAIKRAGSTDGAAVKSALETTSDFPGITGSITFTPEAHVPQKGVTVIAVKDGAFTLAEEVVPESVPAP
jgi:branched-chain amino acid transport system substrate-binding protein